MRDSPYSSAFKITLVVCLLAATPVLAQSINIDPLQTELDQTRERVANLEFSYNRLDRRLLEPLDLLIQQLVDDAQYEEAKTVLDQAIQIIRISEGLYSQSQYPLLVRRIENSGNRGDWEAATESMEQLTELLRRKENVINDELIESMLKLVDLHLWGVAADFTEKQSFHFKAASRMNNLAIRVAAANWGRNDTRLAPIMYKAVVQEYLKSVAVDAGGTTSRSLRANAAYGSMRTYAEDRMLHYYTGIGLLTAIRGIYENQEPPDAEGKALAVMYQADWQVLFANPEFSERGYKQSNDLLLQAGIEQSAINEFFQRPKMLPAPEFLSSFDAAIASMSESDQDDIEPSTIANLDFKQWSASFPYAVAPVEYGPQVDFDNDADGFAMFSFNLTGLEEVTRWYRGRYKKSISVAQDLQILEQQFTRSIDWEELEHRIKEVRFRPKLVNGIPQNVNTTLLYRFAAQ